MDVAHRTSEAHRIWQHNRKSSQIVQSIGHIDEQTRAFREWIKTILLRKGINATELAKRAGLSHSTLSRALSDDSYRVNFRADTIAKLAVAGGVSPPQALGGSAISEKAGMMTTGLGEPQATPYLGQDTEGLQSGQSTWTCNTTGLISMGLMPGDRFILDQNQTPKQRDIIAVQQYDHQTGSAETLLRVYADGFAVTPMYLVDNTPRIFLDGNNASVIGVLMKSWRTRN